MIEPNEEESEETVETSGKRYEVEELLKNTCTGRSDPKKTATARRRC
jgi:hypothetical protein